MLPAFVGLISQIDGAFGHGAALFVVFWVFTPRPAFGSGNIFLRHFGEALYQNWIGAVSCETQGLLCFFQVKGRVCHGAHRSDQAGAQHSLSPIEAEGGAVMGYSPTSGPDIPIKIAHIGKINKSSKYAYCNFGGCSSPLIQAWISDICRGSPYWTHWNLRPPVFKTMKCIGLRHLSPVMPGDGTAIAKVQSRLLLSVCPVPDSGPQEFGGTLERSCRNGGIT